MEEFDYIIVGAGSAGCVLADKLTASGRDRVLLLEAGGSDRRLWVRLPIGYGKAFHDPRVNWRYTAEPSDGLGGRRIYWPRGRVLGGSSSINGLVWMRGLPGDFDDWESAGNPGWGWEDVAPVFDNIEAPGRGADAPAGRISVADRSAEYHPIRHHFLDAARSIGLPEAPTERSHWSEGVGPYKITTRRGMRHSAANAFLRPAMRRRNLTVRTGVLADRVAFDGRRAISVRYARRGRVETVRARREIILSAGAIGSPGILQRSGLGPETLLSEFGIPPIHINPAVGDGLQDHLCVDYLFQANRPTLNQVLGTWRGQIREALKYLLFRRGALGLSVNQMGGLVRHKRVSNRPDIQLYFSPLSYTTLHRNKRPLLRPDAWPGLAIGFNSCRPSSRGRVDIASDDPKVPPKIAPNYLATEDDCATAISAARVIERLLASEGLKSLIVAPKGFSPEGASDAEILADFRDRATTVFHPCGTCRMAPEAAGGVVDAALRVYGVEGLRVVDASIFPNITSANTNAPTIMTAAKAAAAILGTR